MHLRESGVKTRSIAMEMCIRRLTYLVVCSSRCVVSVELQPIRQMPGGSSFNEVLVTDPTVSDTRRASGNGGWGHCQGPAPRWVFVAATVCGRHARVMAQAALSFVTSWPRSATYVV